MTRYVALLRAVNVGGTGKLLMADLLRLCEASGFVDSRTYLASGNVMFSSDRAPTAVQAELTGRLEAFAGRPMGVFIRDGTEMERIVAGNPFAAMEPRFTHVVFLDAPPPADALAAVTGRNDEEMHLGRCEIYLHYPSGSGRSTLRIPSAATGTARNLNTVAKLAEMLGVR